MREQRRKIRRRRGERDGERGLVRSRHTESSGLFSTSDDVPRIRDHGNDLGIRRRGCRIDQASQPGNVVGSYDPVAVGPPCLGSQMERVLLTVRAHRPIARGTGRHARILVQQRQSFAHISQDALGLDRSGFLGIQRVGFLPGSTQENLRVGRQYGGVRAGRA